MGKISTIIDMMSKLGVNEDNPDTSTRDIYLSYVQATYNELYAEIARMFPTMLRSTQSVSLTSGVGTLPTAPFQVLKVWNTSDNYSELDPYTLDDQMEATPAMNDTGLPGVYWLTGQSGINAYPLDNSTLNVLYIPNPETLSESTDDSTLIIPVPYRDVLMWGALRYLTYDERDKSSMQELQSVGAMYEKMKGDLMYWLKNGQTRQTIRVKTVLA